MIAPVVAAVETLRAEGQDVETVASLLLNGAAALLLERRTEEEFGQLARQLWRTAARQVQLLDLLDRVTRQKELGVRPLRKGQAARSKQQAPEGSVRPVQRTLREGETS